MGENAPELVSSDKLEALRNYLSWQALASEFMCGIVARGIPLSPKRSQRRALMHQVRSENSQASWLVKRVAELGGEVPEQDEELIELQRELAILCDRSWLEYLACAQVAMRGYMSPYIRALGAVFEIDEEFEGFSREVLIPEVASHFKRSLTDLRMELLSFQVDLRVAALARAQSAEEQAFEIFRRFLAMSYPMLVDLGIETETLENELIAERQQFWVRLSDSLDQVA